MALRVMFDTNAHDAILAAGDLPQLQQKIAAGELAVVTTHIQEDEIRQIKDADRQSRLLDLYRALAGEQVDPAIVISGDITYMSRDEMLAGVAAMCCDLLVSDDKILIENGAVRYAEFARRLKLRP